MAQKIFVVEGRQFRTESDYACARRDKQLIDRLRQETDFEDKEALGALLKDLQGGRYKFMTLLGQDFRDEVEMAWKKSIPAKKAVPAASGRKARGGKAVRQAKPGGEKKAPAERTRRKGAASGQEKRPESTFRRNGQSGGASDASAGEDAGLEEIVEQELRRREKRRKLILLACSVAAICCLGYFAVYSYYDYRTRMTYDKLSELKEKPAIAPAVTPAPGPLYTLDGEPVEKEVLEEYQNLLLKNRKVIGWVKIDDTYIDYPVMQTTDNEYYLDHNMEQEYDKNGTIFMDTDCDVLKPSTNFILYGHHMRNGRMFGQLDLYKDESFYKEHPLISFDTIYEKGTYQIMYVFRSRVYKETEIVFKYYQFIEANGEQEFDSAMEEMAALSLYDTGVTAQYGDQLLTLSTCDYQETDGRFVVVAKKIADEEQ